MIEYFRLKIEDLWSAFADRFKQIRTAVFLRHVRGHSIHYVINFLDSCLRRNEVLDRHKFRGFSYN